MPQYAFETNADILRSIAPDVANRFQDLRREVRDSGPIDAKHRELILLAAFAAVAIKSGLIIHCKIAQQEGATRAECDHAVMMGLSATLGLSPTVDALSWVRQAFEGKA
jgi:alkylhydroperoxidase/carboxymuconolactone decarboxylase family protein YurZ